MIYIVIFIGVVVIGFLCVRFALKPLTNALGMRRRFIAGASHELRTPLSIIKSSVEVALLDKATLHKDVRTLLESNLEEVNRMSHIIKNLLIISQSQSNRIASEEMPMNMVNLAAIVDQKIKNLAPLIKKKKISVSAQLPASIKIWGNKTALEELATNLCVNAITYTPEHGTVQASISRKKNGSTILRIKDTGSGIPPKELAHIFEPFYRGQNAQWRRDGTGLGLAIVKEIVKRHHGSIKIDNNNTGKGTTALVTFPPFLPS